jgi:16S rRNA (cytosine967-C5)-methyltransferase
MSQHADPARLAAFEVLKAVRVESAYSNIALSNVLRARKLTGGDAARTTDLAAGTIRMAGFLDDVISRCVDRDLDELDADVLDVLRLLSYDALVRGTPAYAAVDAGVTLARKVTGEGPARFVNAIGRKIASRPIEDWRAAVAASFDDETARFAAMYSYPRWIVSGLRDALGDAPEELEALLQAQNQPPRPVLVARPGASTVEELLDAAPSQPGNWSPYAVVLTGGSPGSIDAIREGRAGAQDEGSQLIALALADTPVTSQTNTWVDLAAGPGGKAALLGALGAQVDARLICVEPHQHRADLVEQALVAIPGEHEVIQADGRLAPIEPGSADRVLLDAPCSGLGALRRRADSRWRRDVDDLPQLVALQHELLNAAIDIAAPGGVIAYATCSPLLAETSEVIAAVLAERDDVEVLNAADSLPNVTDAADGQFVRLWPHRHGTDGMFLALLRRR